MTNLVRWEPFRELVSLRGAMDRLFEEGFVRPRAGWLAQVGEGTLAVDMYETDEAIVVKSAIPGVKPQDLDISVTGDTLIIKGETSAEEELEEELGEEAVAEEEPAAEAEAPAEEPAEEGE